MGFDLGFGSCSETVLVSFIDFDYKIAAANFVDIERLNCILEIGQDGLAFLDTDYPLLSICYLLIKLSSTSSSASSSAFKCALAGLKLVIIILLHLGRILIICSRLDIFIILLPILRKPVILIIRPLRIINIRVVEILIRLLLIRSSISIRVLLIEVLVF